MKKRAKPGEHLAPAGDLGEHLRAADRIVLRGKWSLSDAIRHLCKVEPKFVSWIKQVGIPRVFAGPPSSDSHFASLVRSIVYQQVSVAAGKSIFEKLLSALGCGPSASMLTPELVRDAAWGSTLEAGKAKQTVNGQTCGLSERKAIYLRSLATHFLDADLLGGDQDLDGIPEEVLKEKLLAVQGIGEWSAHMFLLFTLQRQDVVALGDLGVRRGLAKLYGISDPLWRKMKPEQFLPFVKAWSPYSSLGCALMWRSDAVTMVSSSDRKEAGGKSKKRDRTGDAGPSVGSKRKKISRE